MNAHDIVMTLHGSKDTDARIRVLTSLVLDLFVEVQALRDAHSTDANRRHWGLDESLFAEKSPYQKAYLKAVYTSHNQAGPLPGPAKILAEFYPEWGARSSVKHDGVMTGDQRWRECSILRRLGFTEDEVTRYVEAAQEAETFT